MQERTDALGLSFVIAIGCNDDGLGLAQGNADFLQTQTFAEAVVGTAAAAPRRWRQHFVCSTRLGRIEFARLLKPQ